METKTGFVIEVVKSKRVLFITEYENRIVYTWMKNFAKLFYSEDEANLFAKENRIDYYTVLNIENAKNH